MVVVIVAVTGFLLLVGGGAAVLFWSDDDDSPSTTSVASRPSYSGLPTPPTYSPPTYSPPSFPTSDPTPEPTYSPPPQNYGAIAVGRNGAIGKAWDYDTPAAARRRALNECPTSGCKVLTTFVNGCGAVAYNSRTNKYWGGHGSTKAAAQRNAINNAGGGRWITWVCTTR
ncbi:MULTISPECIES: DUF4189 domain-containing protein [Actinomadura]|uniref:DUF4189 domain-containing protein n=1 Tax=Actinomadura geliboluensis TaxID=882440 RepID=A0A5S4GWT1_9ACTN|nr:DUF4189 domain-containing protein [Actinomadura geliboluensis]TMR30950.1 DUF4189 domain-containing protein [Actinomadura geliboluensis]